MALKSEDKAVAVCEAIGIKRDHALKWLGTAPMQAKKAKDEGGMPRFNLEGPLIGSSAEMYADELVGYTTPSMLRDFLKENKGKEVEININSPGGSVWDANAMVSDLMRHDGAVNIVVSGACLSAATDFLTIKSAKRVAMPGSVFMIHNAWTFAVGDSNDLRKVASQLDKSNESYADRLAANSKLEKDELMAMMDKETWMDENEALEAGFVDEVFGEEVADESESTDTEATESTDDTPDAPTQRGTLAVDSRLALL